MKYTEVYSPKKPRSLQLRGSSQDYLRKAKSYFMVNKENPEVIFDNVKYWDSKF